ncbi:MAG: AraC family transcriptional regulator [Roseburia sp.]|nr:AraC family transcriptional regulator [Roseburia sp.]
MKENRLRRLAATDERQYMMNDNYEVYEKQGEPLGAISFHYHNFYEIIYVLEGEYSSMIENHTYHLHKGDFLLINQNVMHKYHYRENKHASSKRIILWVTARMLEDLSQGDMDLTACFGGGENCAWHFPVYYEEMLRGYLLKLAMSELIEGELPGAKQVSDRAYLSLFFVYLNLLCGRREYLFQDENVVGHPLVEQVNSFVEQHIREGITVDELAEQIHMSKYHFLRKFKELTGLTVHAFIIHKRLIRACELLKEGQSISEVYQNTGFADYSSFLRNFKEAFGVSPRKYLDYYPDGRS